MPWARQRGKHMTNAIIIAVVGVVVIAAGRYIYKAKKSGAKCIGCSAGEGSCSGRCCSCGCGGKENA